MALSSIPDVAIRFAPAVTLLLCLVANGLGSTGVVGQPVGAVSDRLKTAFTPAGSAFSIWGVIYALAVLSVGYMTIWWEHLAPRLGKATYVTLAANFILNGVWIFLWTGASAGPAILWPTSQGRPPDRRPTPDWGLALPVWACIMLGVQ
ncbi:hypothetical protein FNF28_02319 [Cafeteria roenbergensis]|uniref:Tryptophan-rich sensory protein n=1 Tax=Cafeteria roenbergensis TaxID=33653 RepID=A0A5A8DWZ8_CAFRO|nr:hypothetical protein FNF28_02319 [Cafeteria roenbergensis]